MIYGKNKPVIKSTWSFYVMTYVHAYISNYVIFPIGSLIQRMQARSTRFRARPPTEQPCHTTSRLHMLLAPTYLKS